MRSPLLHTALLSLSIFAGIASAQELTVSRLGKNKDGKDDYRYWGSTGGIAAYSFATTACNIGDVPLTWDPNFKNAPTIGSNLFRISNGRVEHLDL